MDEQAWLTHFNPQVLVEIALPFASMRKARLFACACASRVAQHLAVESARQIVQVGERLADDQLLRVARSLEDAGLDQFLHEVPLLAGRVVDDVFHEVPSEAARQALRDLINFEEAEWELVDYGEHRAIVREIFGNPFRPVDFAPWRTGTAVALARQMYDSRDFGAMPILADALQDAGCDNDEVLNHCRGEAAHFRGCWVVDGVLGLE